MKNLHKDITDSIKGGQYFKDALDWYALKYIHPITQRIFLIIITTVSVVMAIVSVNVFFTFLPLVEVVPIVVDVENKARQQTNLKYIGKQEVDSDISLLKYITERYIEARENYIYKDVRDGNKLKYLKESSSRNEFDKYKDYISFENPESPILRYKKNAKRIVQVLEVDLQTEAGQIKSGKQTITAKFRANEITSSGIKKSVWLAKMDVDYQKVEFAKDVNKFSPLVFKVDNYEVQKLSDE